MLVAPMRRSRRVINGEICGVSWSWPRLAQRSKTLKGVALRTRARITDPIRERDWVQAVPGRPSERRVYSGSGPYQRVPAADPATEERFPGSVAKIAAGCEWPPTPRGSGGDVEQLGDEAGLGPDVLSANPPNLPLPDHRHHLVARQRSSRRPETAKAQSWSDQAFHAPMVLFHNVIEKLALP